MVGRESNFFAICGSALRLPFSSLTEEQHVISRWSTTLNALCWIAYVFFASLFLCTLPHPNAPLPYLGSGKAASYLDEIPCWGNSGGTQGTLLHKQMTQEDCHRYDLRHPSGRLRCEEDRWNMAAVSLPCEGPIIKSFSNFVFDVESPFVAQIGLELTHFCLSSQVLGL